VSLLSGVQQMAKRTSSIRVSVDSELKAQASAVLSTVGLSLPDAIELFLYRVISDRSLSLVPNATTRAAMEEARVMMSARRERGLPSA